MSTVVITGASTGIGRALALAWARRSATLVLSARNEGNLREVAAEIEATGGRALVVAGDVTDAAHRRALVETAIEEGSAIDVLVNNAGRGYYATVPSIELDALRALFELNVIAPLALTQLALPQLTAHRGTVVMISSIAGVIAAPRYAAYSASKFALEGIAMAMRAELANDGVRVLVVRPGPVNTPFRSNAERGANETGYTQRDPKAQSAEEVALRTIHAVESGRAIDETSAFVRFSSAVARHAPFAMRRVLARMALRPPPA